MIRQIYNSMDNQLKELQEKYRQDEILLRKKIDTEIKQQMSEKLKELNYKQTENYMEDFLKGYSYFILNSSINCYGNTTTNDYSSFRGFFDNIHLLNNDESLYEDEYIIGLYGDITYNVPQQQQFSTRAMFQRITITFITNYLDIFELVVQFPFNNFSSHRFNTIFNLKEIGRNDIKLFDRQIDIISSVFNRLKFDIINYNGPNGSQNHDIKNTPIFGKGYGAIYECAKDLETWSKYYTDLQQKKPIANLKKECIPNTKNDKPPSNETKRKCCQKCRSEEQTSNIQKLNLELHEVKTKLENYNDQNITLVKIFELNFNDFWAEKMSEISGETQTDISIANLIQNKDDIISGLNSEIISLTKEIEIKDSEIELSYKSKEYEETLKKENKYLKKEIETKDIEYSILSKKFTEIESKYNDFRNQLSSIKF